MIIDRTRAINWNRLQDPTDFKVLRLAESNFWVPEKIAISDDIPAWRTVPAPIKDALVKALASLTLLDTMQYTDGLPSMAQEALTQHEVAVLAQFEYMESVHARSYSSIFATLIPLLESDQAFAWAEGSAAMVKKAEIILEHYRGSDKYKRRILSCFLEGFLFYSGFFLPLYMDSRGLSRTANVIKLIERDEQVHLRYIGYKLQRMFEELSASEVEKYEAYANSLLAQLMAVELEFSQELYGNLDGLMEQVIPYLKYNANRALKAMGFEPRYSDVESDFNPEIKKALKNGNHDFFSLSGSSYVILDKVTSTDSDKSVFDGVL